MYLYERTFANENTEKDMINFFTFPTTQPSDHGDFSSKFTLEKFILRENYKIVSLVGCHLYKLDPK